MIDPPVDYARVLGKLPKGCPSLEEEPEEPLPLTLWFVRDPDVYHGGAGRIRDDASPEPDWIVYPKQQPHRRTIHIGAYADLHPRIGDRSGTGGLQNLFGELRTWTGLLFTPKLTS